jgi:hypothetical protein
MASLRKTACKGEESITNAPIDSKNLSWAFSENENLAKLDSSFPATAPPADMKLWLAYAKLKLESLPNEVVNSYK